MIREKKASFFAEGELVFSHDPFSSIFLMLPLLLWLIKADACVWGFSPRRLSLILEREQAFMVVD